MLHGTRRSLVNSRQRLLVLLSRHQLSRHYLLRFRVPSDHIHAGISFTLPYYGDGIPRKVVRARHGVLRRLSTHYQGVFSHLYPYLCVGM